MPAHRIAQLFRYSRILRRLAFGIIGIALGGVVVLASPLGRVIDRNLSAHFAQLNQRRQRHHLSVIDIAECQVIYNGIALAGQIVSPEGSAIVWHYLHGHGTDLWLNSDYLQTSPVVLRSWKSLKPGESRQFSLRRQAEDWRLSYALNPFSLRRSEHEVLLWQRIEFSDSKTKLNYGLGCVELPDALIHALHPTPFVVYAKLKI